MTTEPTPKPCDMGVDCEEYGVCYANAQGRPDMCPREQSEAITRGAKRKTPMTEVQIKHTRGPWLLAAKPSSIVGWPIVAPQALGRVICSLNYADKAAFGGPQPGDRAFNRESEANGHLIAAAPDMVKALLLIDGEAPVKSVPDYPTVGFQSSHNPEIDDGNDTVREAFYEGVQRGLSIAAEIAREALAKIGSVA